jgi:integrating conjugative element protein (TIGR03765 family)
MGSALSPFMTLRRLHRLVCILVTATGGASCLAGVTTIHEGGPTVPIGQYLAGFFSQGAAAAETDGPPDSTTLPVQFPVATASMRPGRLHAPLRLRTPGWLAAPMFIVGDDPLSRQWLSANRERLQRCGASGLVVNVASLEAFRALRALVREVPMAAGSVDELAQQAGLSVYPLFFGVDGRISQLVP